MCKSLHHPQVHTFVRPMTEMDHDELWYDMRIQTEYLAIWHSKHTGPVLKERIERCNRNANRW